MGRDTWENERIGVLGEALAAEEASHAIDLAALAESERLRVEVEGERDRWKACAKNEIAARNEHAETIEELIRERDWLKDKVAEYTRTIDDLMQERHDAEKAEGERERKAFVAGATWGTMWAPDDDDAETAKADMAEATRRYKP